MRADEYLTDIETIVMLAIARLGDEAYGIRIHQEIREVIGRRVSVPAIYVVVGRLEDKGYLTSRVGEATAARGGRAKKCYGLTRTGAAALRRERAMYDRMWKGARLPVSS